VTRPAGDLDRLLRWYPSAWRERYGAELTALLEDELDGAAPGVGLRLSLAWSGIRQRSRSAGLTGDGGDAALRVRTGALVVLVAWALVVAGGAAFAKVAEHFTRVQPPGAQTLPRGAFDGVVGLAVAGAVLVAVGALLALPASVRFLRSGGWPAVRRRVAWAAGAAAVLAVATLGLAQWAHHLDVHQRNGGDAVYSAAFVAWGLLAASTLGLLTAAGVAIARRIELGRAVLRVEAALAVVVGAVTVGITVAVGLWWAGMARGAPWFLTGGRPGSHPTPVTLPLAVVAMCLVAAGGLAIVGLVRTAGSVADV